MNKLSLVIAFYVSTLNLKSVSYRMFPKKLQSPETNRMIPNKTFKRKILQRETSSFLYQENKYLIMYGTKKKLDWHTDRKSVFTKTYKTENNASLQLKKDA